MVGERLGCKKVEVARPEELELRVGYPPRGVSPIGLEGIRVLIDQGLFEHSTILVGAGEEGVEVEIAPSDLEQLTQATRIATSRGV